jgi:large subunit ribosomal protein L32
MPLPKRRHSNSRTRKRRTHYKLVVPSMSACPRCSEPRLSYHVCPSCGYYGTGTSSRMVIDVSKKQKQTQDGN